MFFEHLMRDLRHALRGFRQRPGFTAIVVATLALGIGSNVSIFSVANSVLLTPLPYENPEELALVWTRQVNSGVDRALVSGPDFLDYQNETTLFEDFAGAFAIPGTMTGEGRAEQIVTGWTTWNLFQVLGIRPIIGRDFTEDDIVIIDPSTFADPTAEIPPGALMLGHGLWQRRFGGDRNVIGTTVEMDGQASVIVGVLPPDFRIYLPDDAGMPTDIDVWRILPVSYDITPRDAEWVTVVTRLKDGVTIEQGQAELDALATRLREQYQFHATSGMHITLNPMLQDVVQHVRPILLALLGAVGFVLLIACANVANLLLVRAAAREREIAVRAALGGGRGIIIRQMLTESGVLAAAGGLLGLGLAWVGVKALVAMRPDNLPRLEAISMDGTVLLFTTAATVLAALLFGVAPALRASNPNLARSLTERSGSGGVRGNKLRTALVVTEVGLSLVLLIGAGLVIRSFQKLQRVDAGFEPANVLSMSVPLPAFGYRVPSTRTDFYMQLKDRISGLPGVQAVGGVVPLPLSGGDQYFVFSYGPLGVSEEDWARNKADYRWTTPGYFETMGIDVVDGRAFEDADNGAGAPDVVVIDEDLARRVWPNESAIGRTLQVEVFAFDENGMSMVRQPMEVIGVVEHVRSQSLTSPGREAAYFPHRMFPFVPQGMVVRTGVRQDNLLASIRGIVGEMDAAVPVADVRFMSELVDDAMASSRFILTLIGAFALMALVLASVGLYGVISYSVRQRTREIGVRITFGAAGSDIVKLIVGHGAVLAAGGIVVGLFASFFLTRIVSSVLYGVTARDPVTFVSLPAILMLVSLAASYIPALRALRTDPVEALREE